MVTKLMAEIQETQETLIKHKTDSHGRHKISLSLMHAYIQLTKCNSLFLFVNFSQELRKEVVELRRSLQQSKVESQYLREELRKAGSQSANQALFLEEKIQLLREV